MQLGQSPAVPFGQRFKSGARQLGHFPTRPFCAQLAVDFGLQFGHFPVVFSGHLFASTLLQAGHLPTVPVGQLRPTFGGTKMVGPPGRMLGTFGPMLGPPGLVQPPFPRLVRPCATAIDEIAIRPIRKTQMKRMSAHRSGKTAVTSPDFCRSSIAALRASFP